MRKLFLLLALIAAPLGATIEFPETGSVSPATPITANGNYAGSKISYGGGVILHVVGTFNGASVALEVNGGGGWVAADTCATMTTAQVCRAAVGPVNLRVTVTSAGGSTSLQIRGFEAEAIVASVSGGGAADWTTITGGTSTEAFLIGTGGTLSATGTGTIDATSAAEIDTDFDGTPEVSVAGGAVILDTDDDAAAEFQFDSVSGSTKALRTLGTALRIYYSTTTVAGEMSATGLSAYNATGLLQGSLLRVATTCTAPSVAVYQATDATTGIGRDATTGALCLTDNGSGVAQIHHDGSDGRVRVFDVLQLNPRAAAPATPGTGDVYYDSDNSAPCVYTGAGFVQVNDLSTPCT